MRALTVTPSLVVTVLVGMRPEDDFTCVLPLVAGGVLDVPGDIAVLRPSSEGVVDMNASIVEKDETREQCQDL